MMRVLSREGAYSQTIVIFYVEVVQAVLLYRLEMWVISLRIWRTLGGFHHQVDYRLIGEQLQKRLDVNWGYPLLTEAMAMMGIQDMET